MFSRDHACAWCRATWTTEEALPATHAYCSEECAELFNAHRAATAGRLRGAIVGRHLLDSMRTADEMDAAMRFLLRGVQGIGAD